MTAEEFAPGEEHFAYGHRAVALGPDALRLPGRGRSVAYPDITHLAVDRDDVRVATRRGVTALARARFAEPGAVAFARALLGRIDALPDGAARRVAFERLDAKRSAPAPRLGSALALLCVLCFVLQRTLPGFEPVGIFSATDVRMGEWWRFVTAQFLHVNVWHLGVDTILLAIVSAQLGRCIGGAALGFVLGASGLGAMGVCLLSGNEAVLGISGIVAGGIGAWVALEISHPELIPATLRIPRTALLIGIGAEIALEVWLPDFSGMRIASQAHAGGFAAGALAGLLVREPTPAPLRAGAIGFGLAVLAAFAWMGAELYAPSGMLARRYAPLLESDDATPAQLNDPAWGIATSRHPSAAALGVAERLALRAVELSGRRHPNILDTLAEVYFAEGKRDLAVTTIDEAIALAPDEPYFAEQRRRFTGERAAEDRPPPPATDDSGEPTLPPGDEVTV
jgi:rhomboid protease GluP